MTLGAPPLIHRSKITLALRSRHLAFRAQQTLTHGKKCAAPDFIMSVTATRLAALESGGARRQTRRVKMLKTMRLICVAAIAALALPAMAGSWPPTPPRKAVNKPAAAAAPSKGPAAVAARDGFEQVTGEAGWQLVQPEYAYESGKFVLKGGAAGTTLAQGAEAYKGTVDGFEAVGGEAGWQLAQHKYVFGGGRLTMSDECDHAIRAAQAATPGDVERSRTFSPGA
jgi:hypothetical protein